MRSMVTFTILLFIGCASGRNMKFTETGDKTFAALTKNCKIRVYTTKPSKKYHEIGVIEWSGWSPSGGVLTAGPGSVAEAKEKAQPEVCKNGGNALLLWEANAIGHYPKATVIRVE